MDIQCFIQTRSPEIHLDKDSTEYVSKHVAKPLKHSPKLLNSWEKIKNLAESLKSPAECLCYNTAYVVPIIHGKDDCQFFETG